jgi:hypothetical protein
LVENVEIAFTRVLEHNTTLLQKIVNDGTTFWVASNVEINLEIFSLRNNIF